MMSDTPNAMFPQVETFGQEGPKPAAKAEMLPEDSNRPKKKGSLAKGRAKKKTLVYKDHYKSASEVVSVSREKMKKLQVGQLPQVTVQTTALQQQSQAEQDGLRMTGLTLPDILMKHSNLWGRRKQQIKKEKIHLEVAGMDMQLPPPKPMSLSRKNQLKRTKLTYGSEHAMFKEVEDIKQILHCHIVGMPVEIKKTDEENKQVARPIFHCPECFDFWNKTGEIRVDCSAKHNPVKGPVILLSTGAAALIKSVWSKREKVDNPQHKGQTDIKQKSNGDSIDVGSAADEVDDIINELNDYDDCSVVLDHIAEGLARNAGFEERVLRTATREIAENLALILSGRKPDDTAMMELIEKYLGETDLMILRGMIETDNAKDMKILKNKSGFDKTQIDNQHEKASKLLDRLAVLKARESNDFRNENVVYLTELFNVRGGREKRGRDFSLDKRGNFANTLMGKEDLHYRTESELQLHVDSSAEDFISNLLDHSNERLVDQKLGRAVGGKYGHQRIARSKQFQSKQDELLENENIDLIKTAVKVEYVPGFRKGDKHKACDTSSDDFNENRLCDKQIKDRHISYKHNPTYSSQDKMKTLTKTKRSRVSVQSSSSTLQYQESVSSKYSLPKNNEKYSRTIVTKGKDGIKTSRAKKSSHKVKAKAHTKAKKGELKGEAKLKKEFDRDSVGAEVHIPNGKTASPSTAEHIVYDFDDDYDDEDDQEQNDLDVETFLIPGSEGYSDSTYNYLVEEFVTHYENMSVDKSGAPMSFNVDNLRKEMQHGVVRKTGLSRKPVVRTESDEEIVNMFRAGSTVNVEQLYAPTDRNNNKSDIDATESFSSPSFYEENTQQTKREGKRHSKKIRAEKPRRVARNKIVIETESDYTDSDGSELFESDSNNLEPPLVNHVSKNQIEAKKKTTKNKKLRSPLGDHDISPQSSKSMVAGQSSTKHISVAETHFGMQLDALSNLPTAPLTDLQAKRKKSLTPATRTKVVSSLPKESVRAYHSRQIENANFSGGSQVKDKENIEEIVNSTTDLSELPSETTSRKREIKKKEKLPVKLGMSRKSDSKRKMSRTETVMQSVTSESSRPRSSNLPLPPIHKTSQNDARQEIESPDDDIFQQPVCLSMMEKPIAVVKPITQAKLEDVGTDNTEEKEMVPTAESTKSDEIEDPIYERPRIYIPESEISILSFTSSFSFSLFSLPNQYKKQNEDVKNAVYRVGKTQSKEATQEILSRIPTRDKAKSKGPSKNNKILNGLSKRIIRKVADPKPIARYVKKLEIVKEEQPAEQDDEVSESGEIVSKVIQRNVYDSSNQDASHLNAEIHINVDDPEAISGTDIGIVKSGDIMVMKDYLDNPYQNRKIAYASVPMESQMHLANTESVLIKVQEYV